MSPVGGTDVIEKKDSIKRKSRDNENIQIPRFCVGLFVAYWLLIIAFYFLAGDQLHLRRSRGELIMPGAEMGTVELVQGAMVEQRFTVKIQRLSAVSVQWGTYYRPNAGTVTMELWDESAGVRLLSQNYDAAAIPEGGITVLTAEEPLEGLYGAALLLRLRADSLPGAAVSPLMNQTAPAAEGFSLSQNGSLDRAPLLAICRRVWPYAGPGPFLCIPPLGHRAAQLCGLRSHCGKKIPVSYPSTGGKRFQDQVQTLGAGNVLELFKSPAYHACPVFCLLYYF